MMKMCNLPKTIGCPCCPPSSVSSYSTLKPDTVSEADTHEMTKLLEVISVTDSEVSTTAGGGVVSPSAVATGRHQDTWREKYEVKEFWEGKLIGN